jgi:hypothetical protein
MDDTKKIPDDEITTNAEYVDQSELDNLEDKEGNPIDAVEQNQNEEDLTDEGAKKALQDAIAGNDDNAQDSPLDEENN